MTACEATSQSKQLCDPLLGRDPPVEKCWNRRWLRLGLRPSGQGSEVRGHTRDDNDEDEGIEP